MNEPTDFKEMATGDPWGDEHFDDACPKAIYRCGVRDALRAVLRELGKITHNHSTIDVVDLTEYLADRLRAAVGDAS